MLCILSYPIPRDFYSIPSTKNVPIPRGFIEAFEEGFGHVSANLNKFSNRNPSCLSVHNEVVSNKVLHFGLMPLFMVEHSIILFDPNHPKGNASKEVPNLEFLDKLFRDSSS